MIAIIVNLFAVILTIMVLSRIVGDNPLFRVAQYLFVGVSLGIAFVVAYHQVMRPAVVGLSRGDEGALALYGVPLVLGVLLLPRLAHRQQFSWLANIPLAVIFGVGAALAIGGAVMGTLLPQALDTARPLTGSAPEMAGTLVLALGTVLTLTTFYFTVRRDTPMGRAVGAAAAVGHWVLMVAFGFFFASAVQTYVVALTERLEFMLGWLRGLIGL